MKRHATGPIACSRSALRHRRSRGGTGHAPVHPRRHAARLVQHARARLVGRDLLRPARRRQPSRQQHRGLQRHHVSRAQARDARCRSTCRSRSRSTAWCRTARALHVSPRRQRVLRDARRAAARGRSRRRSPSTITASRRSAKNPPWDGGFIWAQDSLGRPLDRDGRSRAWARACGGRTRTRRPTSRTASASRSRCPIR